MDRRAFVRHAALGALSGALLAPLAACTPSRERRDAGEVAALPDATAMAVLARPGVQLYTMQDRVSEAFEASLARVREVGYPEVEFAGYYGKTPAEVRAAAAQVGLATPAVHVGYDLFEADAQRVAGMAKEAGFTFVVCPWLQPEQRDSLDAYRRHAERFNAWAEVCRASDLRFAYHNHDFEFETFGGEVTAYDVLLAETDPETVEMELDLYWIHHAGYDPVAYFGAHPGRFPLFHVKDATATGEVTSVGAGVIDFGRIFAHAAQAGLEHAFVEHDHAPEPFDSIASSYAYLTALSART